MFTSYLDGRTSQTGRLTVTVHEYHCWKPGQLPCRSNEQLEGTWSSYNISRLRMSTWLRQGVKITQLESTIRPLAPVRLRFPVVMNFPSRRSFVCSFALTSWIECSLNESEDRPGEENSGQLHADLRVPMRAWSGAAASTRLRRKSFGRMGEGSESESCVFNYLNCKRKL